MRNSTPIQVKHYVHSMDNQLWVKATVKFEEGTIYYNMPFKSSERPKWAIRRAVDYARREYEYNPNITNGVHISLCPRLTP